jgi:hypothetical protein
MITSGRIVLLIDKVNSPTTTKNSSIILEAIASKSLWIWHCYFGLLSGKSDFNVLNRNIVVVNMLFSVGNELGSR